MNDNIYGQGIDNHLMGLRYVAKEAGEPIPEIFTDEAYAIVNHFALSTSQVSDQDSPLVHQQIYDVVAFQLAMNAHFTSSLL